MDFKADKKRTFLLLRAFILKSLSTGVKTINQIAKEQNINWKTVELHLTFLAGKGYAKEIFNSQYVRIFEITENGRGYISTVEENFKANNSELTKKEDRIQLEREL